MVILSSLLLVFSIAIICLTLFLVFSQRFKKNRLKAKKSKKPVFNYYEIRYGNPKGVIRHPSYIFEWSATTMKGVNSTHKKPCGKKTIRIAKNPNPKDGKRTYIVCEINEYSKKNVGPDLRKKGWKYDEKDISKIMKVINKKRK